MSKSNDRRVARTKAALINAFNDLVVSGRKKNIRVSDIVEHANVGRSTFYEHYSNADDIHMQALASPFSILADSVMGVGDNQKLVSLLEHFWKNRQRAKATIAGQTRERVTRLLADLIEERITDNSEMPIPKRMVSVQLAEGALSLIRIWISGETSCTPSALAEAIFETSARSRTFLFKVSHPKQFAPR